MTVRVRLAEPADFPAIARLTLAAYENDNQVQGTNGYGAVLVDVAARALAGELLVAVDPAGPSAGAAERSPRSSGPASQPASAGPSAGAAERSPRSSGPASQPAPAGETLVGAVLFVLPGSPYAELAGPGEAEFRMLAVDPAAQGRGIARALVQRCLDRAAAAGCSAVVICVRSGGGRARRLYDRFGFERVPELDWSPLPGIDLLALRRPVSPPP